MIIDANKVLVTLAGDPYKMDDKDLTIGLAVAKVVSEAKTGDPLRSMVLAKKFYDGGELDLKSEDIVFVKEKLTMVLDNGQMAFIPFITGQILEELDK